MQYNGIIFWRPKVIYHVTISFSKHINTSCMITIHTLRVCPCVDIYFYILSHYLNLWNATNNDNIKICSRHNRGSFWKYVWHLSVIECYKIKIGNKAYFNRYYGMFVTINHKIYEFFEYFRFSIKQKRKWLLWANVCDVIYGRWLHDVAISFHCHIKGHCNIKSCNVWEVT